MTVGFQLRLQLLPCPCWRLNLGGGGLKRGTERVLCRLQSAELTPAKRALRQVNLDFNALPWRQLVVEIRRQQLKSFFMVHLSTYDRPIPIGGTQRNVPIRDARTVKPRALGS